jgi:hypothetical protein
VTSQSLEALVAVLASQLERARHDMDEIAELSRNLAHENQVRIDELRTEIAKLKQEVLKYKWLTSGVVACLAAIATVLQYVGIDYFKK